MQETLWPAVEKLNSDVRNYLTPILAYADLLLSEAPESDRRKLATIISCAESIRLALEQFVALAKATRP